MKISPYFRKTAILASILLTTVSCTAEKSSKAEVTAKPEIQTKQVSAPNIVFILADDLGISDIAAYANHFTGTPIKDLYYETPNMDRLASKGISFSQAYGAPNCAPARSSLMTGKVAARVGFTTAVGTSKTYFNQGMKTPPGSNPHDVLYHKDWITQQQAWMNGSTSTGLDPELTLMPEVLNSHHSVFMGKWHLGGGGVKTMQPGPQGFDEVLASFDLGQSKYHYNNVVVNRKSWPRDWRQEWPEGWDVTTPSFKTMDPETFDMGHAGSAPHADYLTDDLTNRAVNFIDRYNKDAKPNKKPFYMYLSHFAVHAPFHAPKGLLPYFEAKPQRGTLGHSNAAYAAMISRLDESVGRIMAILERTGLDKNTLVVFTSDNGGAEYTNPAATDNAPFKGGKGSMYEGGVRVPLIVYMPDRFEGGTWRDQVVSMVDFMPTLAEITGNDVPEGIDGKSFIPVLEDANADLGERAVIWHYPFNVIVNNPNDNLPLTPFSGIRRGDYKLLWDWHGKLELYNIVKDPYENNDISAQMGQKRDDLFNKLHSWLLANVSKQYMPSRNKDYDESKDVRQYPFVDLSGALTR